MTGKTILIIEFSQMIKELALNNAVNDFSSSQVTRRWFLNLEKRSWQLEKGVLIRLELMNVYFSGTFPYGLKTPPPRRGLL